MSEPVIACSLNASEQKRRLELAADLSARALVETEEMQAGLRLRFADRTGVAQELEQLIEAESQCCSFMRFDLAHRRGALVLEVSGPDQAQPLIRELFGLQAPSIATQ